MEKRSCLPRESEYPLRQTIRNLTFPVGAHLSSFVRAGGWLAVGWRLDGCCCGIPISGRLAAGWPAELSQISGSESDHCKNQ
eukprot:COSAG01_NODE_1691_length_9480_cov_5.430231_10_plen_82_part_00